MTRVKDAGDSALLVEWDETIDPVVNSRAIAAAAAIRRASLKGLRDVVPTYRSVAVFFDPLTAEPDRIRETLTHAAEAPLETVEGKTIDVPVHYGGEVGPDLGTVADWAGLKSHEVIDRHAAQDYRVFMLGFLPGFAYLGSVDARIAAPRRDTPRLRVPAGAVAIAGRQTGVYPRESPGGWQVIGRSPARVFDAGRVPAALFAPGDRVRFVPASDEHHDSPSSDDRETRRASSSSIGARTITVVRPGLFTTIQDRGRWGSQASGVSVSGALDLISHRLANVLVGNSPEAATLEVTLAGPELRVDQDTRLVITGADLQATIDGKAASPGVPMLCRAGGVVRFGERRAGARVYIGVEGGIDVADVLGSRATHVGSALGGVDGRALLPGDRLPLGTAINDGRTLPSSLHLPMPRGGARLRVLAGPQDDFFPESALAALDRSRFLVTPQSNRMGYRLSGATLARVTGREMISDATFVGGIQVPASGEPILLMSDRQTSGGYPQIATVITADLPLAGQLAPGDWVEFARCTREEAIAALRDQEAMFSGLA